MASSRFAGVEARLHGAGQTAIQGGYGDTGRGQASPAHGPQNVDVAGDRHRFGDDAERMPKPLHHLEDRTGRIQLTLDRLIGIGIAAYVDAFADVAWPDEFLLQQTGGLGFEEEAALEIQTRG